MISGGVTVGQGVPEEMMGSEDPFLKQFFHALPDGPISFHFPARPYAEDLGCETPA